MKTKLYGIDDAAKYLGISRHTVRYHLYKSHRLQGQRISDAVVFTQEQLDTFKKQDFTRGPKTKEK